MRKLLGTGAINSKVLVVIQSLFVICWLSILADTDSLHSIYSFCAIGSVFCLCSNYAWNQLYPKSHRLSTLLVSLLFSIAVSAANYPIFLQVRDPEMVSAATNRMENLLNLACCLLGGTLVAWNILTFLLEQLPLPSVSGINRNKAWLVFFVSFGVIAAIDLIYLFLDEYPGHVTPDSLDQILQGYLGAYKNDHPFWHTYWIKTVLTLGYALFGSANKAVALFSILQILFMATCFAYGVMTLYQAGVPNWCTGLTLGIYAFMPYNIAMSITIWKDVPFAGGCLIFVISLYRLLTSLDKRSWISILMLAAGAVILSLSRNLGVFIVLVVCLLGFPLLWKKRRCAVFLLAVVVFICILLTGPVLTMLGVENSDFTESLSIPLQQLARVVHDGCPLTKEEEALLNKIFDLDEIPQLYTDWLADPIKLEVRENDVAYLRENLAEYGKLWVRLGLKYPAHYAKAWIDQTKGYWNGGYDYHQYVEMVEDNTLGIAKTSGGNIVAKLIYLYFGLTRHGIFFQLLLSIGLQVWILAACCYVNLTKKRKEYLLSVPVLFVIIALLVGTPVYAEFRYAYSAFITCPVVLLLTVFGNREATPSLPEEHISSL